MTCCSRAENFEKTANVFPVPNYGPSVKPDIYICRECKRYFVRPVYSSEMAVEVSYVPELEKWKMSGMVRHNWQCIKE